MRWCSNAPELGDLLLLQLFSSLPQLPVVPQLRHTAAMLLAAYADWLAQTLSAGAAAELMPQLLQMLTTGTHFDSQPLTCGVYTLMLNMVQAWLIPVKAKWS